MDYKTSSEEETIKIAQDMAEHLSSGDILALYGDLGVGKSVFCRALIRTLTHTPDLNVPSPTFSLVQTYETSAFEIWHFDLYRIEDPEEIYEIGWEEALSGNLSLIEWPDKIEPLLPPNTKKLIFEEISPTERLIKTSF